MAGAEADGYEGLVLTVDAPLCGNREADLRTGCVLPAVPNTQALSSSHGSLWPLLGA
jgi:isopentenyl diphosphate isomerase/L-lactate dehydrogenase-like FMN-dependent dehydrogenase